MADKTSVELSGRFPKGTRAELTVLTGAVPSPGGPAKSTTVGDDGLVRFNGCLVGAQYVVSLLSDKGASLGTFAVQAKDDTFNEDANLHRDGPEATARRLQADREAQAKARAEAEKTDPLVASPAPGRTVTSNKPKRKTPSVAEPQPGPRQDETSGPQRSDTPDGLGTPKDPKEHVPDVPQEAVAKGAYQRSSTETGVAAVKDPSEQVPARRQEDTSGVPQRSDTPHGQAEPKPRVKGAQVEKRATSSANRARGNTRAKSEEQTQKRPKRKTTRNGTAKRATTTKTKK